MQDGKHVASCGADLFQEHLDYFARIQSLASKGGESFSRVNQTQLVERRFNNLIVRYVTG